jgi:hypothetical protein
MAREATFNTKIYRQNGRPIINIVTGEVADCELINYTWEETIDTLRCCISTLKNPVVRIEIVRYVSTDIGRAENYSSAAAEVE